MNYGQLKTAVLDYMHRPDLTAEVAGFVRLAEGMIRRDLRADTYSVTLDADDRVEAGVYTLPSTLLEIRSVRIGNRTLTQVGPSEIRQLYDSAPPLNYCVHGSTMEIRGAPSEETEIHVRYFGHPAELVQDADDLALDEALYLYGALFFGYQFTQDLELAQAALDTFADALQKLNEAAGRKLGGARMQGVYHFGPVHRGY